MKKLIALVALAACLLWPARSQAMYVDGMELYEYVQSNPTTLLDPSGLNAVPPGPRPPTGPTRPRGPKSPLTPEKKECNKARCRDLADEIRLKRNEIDWRYRMLQENPLGLDWDIRRPGGTVSGHVQQYYDAQQSLLNLLDEADELGCDPGGKGNSGKGIPLDASEWAKKPVPVSKPFKPTVPSDGPTIRPANPNVPPVIVIPRGPWDPIPPSIPLPGYNVPPIYVPTYPGASPGLPPGFEPITEPEPEPIRIVA